MMRMNFLLSSGPGQITNTFEGMVDGTYRKQSLASWVRNIEEVNDLSAEVMMRFSVVPRARRVITYTPHDWKQNRKDSASTNSAISQHIIFKTVWCHHAEQSLRDHWERN
jgi:hypothetical protein